MLRIVANNKTMKYTYIVTLYKEHLIKDIVKQEVTWLVLIEMCLRDHTM
jgi:hypothetical protein